MNDPDCQFKIVVPILFFNVRLCQSTETVAVESDKLRLSHTTDAILDLSESVYVAVFNGVTLPVDTESDPVILKLPEIIAEPVYGNAGMLGAKEALNA